MDVRTICLGILTRGDATGYEIKKLVEGGGFQHFAEASFGSIYPALNGMTQTGLVSVRAEAQEKRPDRKVYSITPKGRSALIATLLKPLPEDRHRSPFMFAIQFADLLPKDHISQMLDAYTAQIEEELRRLRQTKTAPKTTGESFVRDLGLSMYAGMLDYLRTHRGRIETPKAEAAE
jgi:DNA-binding PadR family transcriptional regulator